MAHSEAHSETQQDTFQELEQPRSKGGGGLLFLFGFGMTAAGVALATAPHFSWKLVQIGRQASALGIDNGALMVGGFVVFMLGFVARTAARAGSPTVSAVVSSGSDGSLVGEQVAADLIELKRAVHRVNQNVGTLFTRTEGLATSQQTLLERSQGSSEGEGGDSQAMFGLAASVDKLGAMVESKNQELDASLQAKLEHVLATLETMRVNLMERLDGMPAAHAGHAGHASHDSHNGHDGAGGHGSHSAPQESPAVAEAADHLEVLVDLENEDEPKLEFFDTVNEIQSLVGEAVDRDDTPEPNPVSTNLELDVSHGAAFGSTSADSLEAFLPEDEKG